jgi:hypothetical protein
MLNRYLITSAHAILAIAMMSATAFASNELTTTQLNDTSRKHEVTVHFLSKGELYQACGKKVRGCAMIETKSIFLPEDRSHNWVGTRSQALEITWEEWKDISCKRTVACVKDGIVHAANLRFDHARMNEFGAALAEVLGLEYNRRLVTVLGHEMKHILTTERHLHIAQHKSSKKKYSWKKKNLWKKNRTTVQSNDLLVASR